MFIGLPFFPRFIYQKDFLSNRFSYSVQQVPADVQTVCKDPKSPFFRLLNFRDGNGNFPNTFLMDFASLMYKKSYYDKAKFILDDYYYDDDLIYNTCWKMFEKAGALVSVQVDSPFYTEVNKSRKLSFASMIGMIGEKAHFCGKCLLIL